MAGIETACDPPQPREIETTSETASVLLQRVDEINHRLRRMSSRLLGVDDVKPEAENVPEPVRAEISELQHRHLCLRYFLTNLSNMSRNSWASSTLKVGVPGPEANITLLGPCSE